MTLSTMRQILNRAGPAPANDVVPHPTEMTLDDLEAALENARHRAKRAQNELEQRLAEFHDAEKAFVDRIGPQLTHHVIIERTEEESEE
jgi:hypothetical protein